MSIIVKNNRGTQIVLTIFLGTLATALYAAIGRPMMDPEPYNQAREDLIKRLEESTEKK